MAEKVFHCNNCGAKLSAGDDEVGEEFECPVCDAIQIVPGESDADRETKTKIPSVTLPSSSLKTGSGKVVRIPKKKIVLSNSSHSRDEEDDYDEYDEELEEEIDEEVGGSGLRVAAMAVGTGAVVLCAMSFLWALVANGDGEMNWWLVIISFIALFLLALMGIVLAQIAFRVERIAAYVRRMVPEE